MNIYQELKARGFCYQQTDEEAIEKLLTTEQVKFYVGFDPTGNSLHVGHLLPVMAMRLMQKAGHIPIVLVGGATAQIGDPSGRISARPMMTLETIAENVRCLRAQLARFIDASDGRACFVNNADWLCKIGYIEMLREVGSIFSVNRMLAQESVKSRLENGLSFLEFNYSILQGYDFYVLNRDSRGNVTISSPLEAHKSQTIVLTTEGLDVGYDNPMFACLELNYGEADEDSTGEAAQQTEKVLTYYQLDLGLNHVIRKWSPGRRAGLRGELGDVLQREPPRDPRAHSAPRVPARKPRNHDHHRGTVPARSVETWKV